jgi:hypothetical protein
MPLEGALASTVGDRPPMLVAAGFLCTYYLDFAKFRYDIYGMGDRLFLSNSFSI